MMATWHTRAGEPEGRLMADAGMGGTFTPAAACAL